METLLKVLACICTPKKFLGDVYAMVVADYLLNYAYRAHNPRLPRSMLFVNRTLWHSGYVYKCSILKEVHFFL